MLVRGVGGASSIGVNAVIVWHFEKLGNDFCYALVEVLESISGYWHSCESGLENHAGLRCKTKHVVGGMQG